MDEEDIKSMKLYNLIDLISSSSISAPFKK